MWLIDFHLIEDWLDKQDTEAVALIFAAFELLRDRGPSLGRPLVDTLKGSEFKNLKELRPASSGRSEVRIIFAFDPERHAIMLLAGDKAGGNSARRKWSRWYKTAIPLAEERFEEHLKALEARYEKHG